MPVLCPSHHCVWEADDLPGCTGSELDRYCSSGRIVSQPPLIPDLEDILMRLWTLNLRIDIGMS